MWQWVLPVALVVLVAACGDDDAATTTAEPAPPGADTGDGFFAGLAPEWVAEALDDRFYGIEVSFNGAGGVGDVIADVAYPGLDCAGSWTLTSVDGSEIEAGERIPINPDDTCTDGGSVRLTRSGNTIDYQWFYPSGQPSDTGTLRPAP
jgi:hypothetical protein